MTMRLSVVSVWTIGLALAAQAAALDLDSVRACLAANAPSRSARIALDLRSEDAAGQRTEQRARVLWRRVSADERRVLLRMEAPVSVAGSALLAIARHGELPEIHLYLQDLGRSRRIYRPEQLRGFLGRSGVELAELWRMIEPNGELAERWVEEGGRREGRPVWVVEGELRRPRQATAQRVVSHVDQESCIPLRVETWDAGGRLLRIVSVDPSQLAREQGRWVPREILFEDLGSGSRGSVRVTSLELDASMAPGLFTVKSLEVGP
jgi:hypothetical protein